MGNFNVRNRGNSIINPYVPVPSLKSYLLGASAFGYPNKYLR